MTPEEKSIQEQIAKGQIPTRRISADIPTEEIDLPSQGRYYPEGHPLSSGKILLKYPTAREEDILTSRNLIMKGSAIDTFLSSLIVDKTINIDDMLLGDKNSLFIAARILAYGKEYPVEIKCPSCTEQNRVVIDISQFEAKEIEDIDKIYMNEFQFTLPASGATVTFKVLNGRDFKESENILKQSKKSLKTPISPEMTTRIRVSLLSIQTKDSNVIDDRLEIKNFVDNMLAIDAKAFRDEMVRISPDIDSVFIFECENCGYTERMRMPLGANFFWPGAEESNK